MLCSWSSTFHTFRLFCFLYLLLHRLLVLFYFACLPAAEMKITEKGFHGFISTWKEKKKKFIYIEKISFFMCVVNGIVKSVVPYMESSHKYWPRKATSEINPVHYYNLCNAVSSTTTSTAATIATTATTTHAEHYYYTLHSTANSKGEENLGWVFLLFFCFLIS